MLCPPLPSRSYVYYIRDLMMFLWGGAIAAQSLVDSKGWKDVLVSTIGGLTHMLIHMPHQ